MWERKEVERDRADSTPRVEQPRTAAAPSFQSGARHSANIGQSLFIKGEVSGSEDLTVDGRVEGRIDLKDHNLTIGPNGRVKAELHARNITIIGEVTGNVVADEKVDLTESGRLVGDMRAPRIAISDGAQFKGSVDMLAQIPAEKQERNEKQDKTQGAHKMTAAAQAPAVQVAQAGKGIQ